MRRSLVLFAREPGRQAREKGFARPEAAGLFAAFARGWLEAGRFCGADLVVSTPPEDLGGFRRHLKGSPDPVWLPQRGSSFGQRLEDAARRAAAREGPVVLVGGDVAPSSLELRKAFRALEQGADAVLAPAPDGGVSLVALRPEDLDLLGGLAIRRRDVFATLRSRLSSRRRRVRVLGSAPDLDGRRGLRTLRRSGAHSLESLARLAARPLALCSSTHTARPPRRPARSPIRLRAPPAG
jgi:hypothetical protein